MNSVFKCAVHCTAQQRVRVIKTVLNQYGQEIQDMSADFRDGEEFQLILEPGAKIMAEIEQA